MALQVSKTWMYLVVSSVALACSSNSEPLKHEGNGYPVSIDDETWLNVRHSDSCAVHAPSAIAYYWEDPKFRNERDVYAFSYFVNETTNCWIELHVEGITGESIVLKMSSEGEVIDARMQNHFEPRFTPYPTGYIHLE